ncbi:MAG: ATP-binding protein [Peptococcaceae bacterium]|nr:ATP-binding protein [Peptococcaceae bacterium]
MRKNRFVWELGWRPLLWFGLSAVFFYLAVMLAGILRTGPLAGLLLWLIPTLFLAWFMVRKIVRPLGGIIRGAGELAHGNLERQIIVDGGELGDLARSINILAGRLRKAKRRMAEETDLSRAILNSMMDAVVALDREGRVRLVNQSAERTFGISEDACLGKTVVGVIRSFDLERLVQGVLADGRDIVEEIPIVTDQPRTFLIHVTGLAALSAGVVAILRDRTEARSLERARSDFFANVSHELRTPLTSIKGFLETLLDGSLDNQAATRHFLEVMNAEAVRLSRLIDDLFLLSDIENRRRVFKREQVAVDALIDRVRDMFALMAQERGVSLRTSVAASLPPAWGDADMITQVLVNLVDNAVKYTPGGGEVEVSAFLDDTRRMVIRVSDTGVGIGEDDLPRIFERFYRVDKARSRAQGGTGLGLSIVKHIVETLDGRIEVASSPGRGSTFTVRLVALFAVNVTGN